MHGPLDLAPYRHRPARAASDTDRLVEAARTGAIALQRSKSCASPIAPAYYDEAGQRHELNWDASQRIRLNPVGEPTFAPTGSGFAVANQPTTDASPGSARTSSDMH
ncbi:MAG: hypothetical protein MUF54_07150 [Polyangiaceae bacterium]|nr:hypothetical protein [Polyangiaceae bacterium]